MYRTLFFVAVEPEQQGEEAYYSEVGHAILETNYRPQVGDLVPETLWRPGKTTPPWSDKSYSLGGAAALDALGEVHLLEIERVLLAGPDIFHAYCKQVASVRQGDTSKFVGVRGDLKSLLLHYIVQANTFWKRYSMDPSPDDD